MKDQHSGSDADKEPVRPRTIPDDFIWDPEVQAWYPPGEPSNFDLAAFSRNLDQVIAEGPRKGLITVDELRAAGALRRGTVDQGLGACCARATPFATVLLEV